MFYIRMAVIGFAMFGSLQSFAKTQWLGRFACIGYGPNSVATGSTVYTAQLEASDDAGVSDSNRFHGISFTDDPATVMGVARVHYNLKNQTFSFRSKAKAGALGWLVIEAPDSIYSIASTSHLNGWLYETQTAAPVHFDCRWDRF